MNIIDSSTYNNAVKKSLEMFPNGIAKTANWTYSLAQAEIPLEACTVFPDLDSALIYVGYKNNKSDKTTAYKGKKIIVAEDDASTNNGVYYVVASNDTSSGLGLSRILTEHDASIISGKISSRQQETGKIYLMGQNVIPQQDAIGTLYYDPYVYVENGDLYHTSDERLKNIISSIEIDFSKLSEISKILFQWKDKKTDKNVIGVTAQSVEKVFPELISEDENGIKHVNYEGLSVIALAAIDKLNERLEHLEDKMGKMRADHDN